MSRYRGARLRIVRQFDLKQTLRGLTRKRTENRCMPGQHRKKRNDPTKKTKNSKKVAQYQIRLQEKQKLRFNYGITESQLINYVRQARKTKGSTGETLLQLLEMRLDNIVFRLGIAPTIPAARQLVNHGHIAVNNKKVDISSYQCQPQDVISVTKNKTIRTLISNFITLKTPKSLLRNPQLPSHLIFNKSSLLGTIKSLVPRRWIGLKIKELLIVEFYSRKA